MSHGGGWFEYEGVNDWPEILAFILLMIGFAFALFSSVTMNYVLITLAGLIFGRTLYRHKRKWRFTSVIVILGFLGGFLLGAFGTDRRLVIVLFVLAVAVSFWIHEKKYITSVEI